MLNKNNFVMWSNESVQFYEAKASNAEVQHDRCIENQAWHSVQNGSATHASNDDDDNDDDHDDHDNKQSNNGVWFFFSPVGPNVLITWAYVYELFIFTVSMFWAMHRKHVSFTFHFIDVFFFSPKFNHCILLPTTTSPIRTLKCSWETFKHSHTSAQIIHSNKIPFFVCLHFLLCSES